MQDDDSNRKEDAGLPRDVQEHLGRRLRTELNIEGGKPSFLGDSNLPPQFEPLVRKLEASQNGERQGYEAVKRAILGEEPEPAKPAATPSSPSSAPLRPKIPKRLT